MTIRELRSEFEELADRYQRLVELNADTAVVWRNEATDKLCIVNHNINELISSIIEEIGDVEQKRMAAL